jgi:LPXTG-motif cell wall-anchored protein
MMSSRGLRKVLFPTLLPALLVTVLLASPAMAQEEHGGEPVYTSQEGPGYEVYEDGTFVIGGDVVGNCGAVLQETRQTGRDPSPEILRQVEVCTEAGFPPRGSESLPETGGPLFPIIAIALLLSSALCFLGVRRKQVRT